ncbi:MAG: hypothetical protein K2M04_06640 [Muribaculaceae bacterium]|nr:hypothetical protein [Muribaculaceae bacterium]
MKTLQSKKILLFGIIGFFIQACSDEVPLPDTTSELAQHLSRRIDFHESTARLSFDGEDDLINAIEDDEFSLPSSHSTYSIEGDNNTFVSMTSPMVSADGEILEQTYYEYLGYDTLVPNENFAKLLNINGELEVGIDVIKITPEGTYRFEKEYEDEFKSFYTSNSRNLGTQIDSIRNKINDHIILYRTFEEDPKRYPLFSEGDNTFYPDSIFGDDDDLREIIPGDPFFPGPLSTYGYSEPNINSFPTFSADRKTKLGKFIQSLIGASKSHHVKFNDKRRITGKFYFYNYGVYSEIGVSGYTEKKNWIGWSKTSSDEIRVGWSGVVLKSQVDNSYRMAMQNVRSVAYDPIRNTTINGKNYKTATLIMPEIKSDLKSKLIAAGANAVYDYIKQKLTKPSDLDKVEAFIVASPDEVYFTIPAEKVAHNDVKKYCHVFKKEWCVPNIGFSLKTGFFIGQINKNNVSEIGPWVNTAINCIKQEKTELVGGEVYICARYSTVWKGMKIQKK